jgi:large subunit ribosomal protein L9
VATKKVVKKVQAVLVQPVAGLGKEGTLASVRLGYFRNYLLPQGIAKLADESILADIKRKKVADEAVARKVLDEAKALATALSTIGKFTVKVKVGEEKRIFGRCVCTTCFV